MATHDASPTAPPEAPAARALPPDLALVPADSEAIVHVDLTRLANSSLWALVRPQVVDGWLGAELARVRTACGFDPLGTVRSITIGYRHLDTAERDLVAVVHGIGRAQALACARTLGARITGDQALAASTGLRVIADDTAVVVRRAQLTAADLDALRPQRAPLTGAPVLLDLVAKVHTGDAVWMLGAGAPITRVLGSLGLSPTAASASLELTSGLHLDLRVRAADPADATRTAERVRTLLGALTGTIGALAITTEAADVHLVMDVSGAQLAKLAGLAELP